MRDNIDDLTIDKILSEHTGEEELSKVLGRLNIIAPPNTNWPWDLRDTKLFTLLGSPDYLKITPFGKDVKQKGGWLMHLKSQKDEKADLEYQKKLDREIKEIILQQMKASEGEKPVTNRRISAVQKKELNDIFSRTGLNIRDFEISQHHDANFQLKDKRHGFVFSITHEKVNKFSMIYNGSTHVGLQQGFTSSWQGVLNQFKLWVSDIYSELNTETGWDGFQSSGFPVVLNITFQNINEPFSEADKKFLKDGLIFLGGQIQDIAFAQEEHSKLFQHKLNELSDKLDTLSKFDWLAQFAGTIGSLITFLAVPPEQAGLIWNYVSGLFTTLKLK